MFNASIAKQKVENVFSLPSLGGVVKKNILVNHYTSGENDFGEFVTSFSSQETFPGFVFDYVSYAVKYDEAGLFPNASFVIIMKEGDSVETIDVVEMFNKSYNVVGISWYPLGEELLAKKVFVKEAD